MKIVLTVLIIISVITSLLTIACGFLKGGIENVF